MLVPPLNDTECLTLLHQEAERLMQRPAVQARATEFEAPEELVDHIRSLEQRDDLGDPDDGPRLPCEVSQRARWAPEDPNCYERVLYYHTIAELIDPATERTTASMILDNGWHTFPVEIRNGLPEIIVLDPIPPPRNTMAATAYRAAKVSPRTHLSPWFHELVRNACMDADAEDIYDRAMDTLRNALATGEPLDDPDAVEYVMAQAAQDASLWGAPGRAAYERVERSLRNLSIRLDRDQVRDVVDGLIDLGEKHAPVALKAALVAQYGPAAAIALEGVNLVVEQRPKRPSSLRSPAAQSSSDDAPHASEPRTPRARRIRFPHLERLRKMTLAFR